jgi:hypothetical protein
MEASVIGMVAVYAILFGPPMVVSAIFWLCLQSASRQLRFAALLVGVPLAVGVGATEAWSGYRHLRLDSLAAGDSISGIPFRPDSDALGEATVGLEEEPPTTPRVVRQLLWTGPLSGDAWSFEVDPKTSRIVNVTSGELRCCPNVDAVLRLWQQFTAIGFCVVSGAQIAVVLMGQRRRTSA